MSKCDMTNHLTVEAHDGPSGTVLKRSLPRGFESVRVPSDLEAYERERT